MMGILRKPFHRGEVDCIEIRKRSSDYLAEDLAPTKLAAMRAHLSCCGPCQAFAHALASTIGILSRFPKVSAPPSFKDTVMAQVKQDK